MNAVRASIRGAPPRALSLNPNLSANAHGRSPAYRRLLSATGPPTARSITVHHTSSTRSSHTARRTQDGVSTFHGPRAYHVSSRRQQQGQEDHKVKPDAETPANTEAKGPEDAAEFKPEPSAEEQ